MPDIQTFPVKGMPVLCFTSSSCFEILSKLDAVSPKALCARPLPSFCSTLSRFTLSRTNLSPFPFAKLYTLCVHRESYITQFDLSCSATPPMFLVRSYLFIPLTSGADSQRSAITQP